MSASRDVHVVLGATGGAGRAVVQELLDRGHPVRAVSRSGGAFPDAVEVVTADCTDAEAARRACEGAAVVYNCLNVPYERWPDLLPTLTESSIKAAAHADAPLIMTDNLYMYGASEMPMTEETPRRPEGPKGRLRVELEEMLMDAHETGRARVAIGRASDFYGPHAHSAPRELVFEAVLDGTTAAWLGSLDAPHTMTYLPDFAQGLVTLGTREEALGEVWHLPSNDPITGRRFIEMVYGAAGQRPSMKTYGYWSLTAAGLFDAQIWEAREVLYQFREPFVMDTAKFEEAFGRDVTPYDTAISDTLDWHRARRAEANT
jgi:nucleoside-diphosphate-sugar epimerase